MDGNFDVQALKQPIEVAPPAAQTKPETPPAESGSDTSTQSTTPSNQTTDNTSTQSPASAQPTASAPADGTATATEGAAAPAPTPSAAPAPAAPEPSTEPKPSALTQDEIVRQAQSQLLKQLGVASLEELQDRLKPAETPEMIADRQRQYVADLDSYAIKNNYVTKDDIINLETMKRTDPTQIVYQEFAKNYKAADPEATDDLISTDFRLAYNLDATSQSLKQHGENMIKRQAEAIINTLEHKYQSAKTAFDSDISDRSKVPAFKSLIKQSLEQHVPQRMMLGNEDVGLEIDPAMKAEVEKYLVSQTTFEEFKQMGDSPQLRDHLKARIEGYLLMKHKDTIFKTIYEAGKAIGLKQGSTTGATEPFPLAQNGKSIPVASDSITKEDDAKLARLFG